MAFYSGCYTILSDEIAPKHDSSGWVLPDRAFHSGHMSDTSNVEELHVYPEEMDLLPTQIQFGACEWSDDGFAEEDVWTEFYADGGAFYVRGFSPTDSWTPSWYTSGGFYVRGFSPTNTWAEFYMGGSEFYTGLFANLPSMWQTSFYPGAEFYVRNFTATDLWSEFYAPAC